MVDEKMELDQVSTKKKISQPPLNLLFNPSLIERNDVWKIDIVRLLETLLSTLTKSSYKDLRVCGVAILTSTLIHRLKVESIFRLEKKLPVKINKAYQNGTRHLMKKCLSHRFLILHCHLEKNCHIQSH